MDGRSALRLLDLILDSFVPWPDAPVDPAGHPDPAYRDQLERARTATGLAEAVVTGTGELRGRRVAVIASEFAFLGGSIGVDTARRIVEALRRAERDRMPLIVFPASGGTRLQEGTTAFVRMAAITAAVQRYRAAGLPYVVYLRHPTTGGVLASWASLGHVTLAEPGAVIGFLGPRAQGGIPGGVLPPGVQTAENLFRLGLVDGVVPPPDLAAELSRVLALLTGAGPTSAGLTSAGPAGTGPTEAGPSEAGPSEAGPADVWASVRASRRTDRPGAAAVLEAAATDLTPLATGAGHPGIRLALARFGGRSAVVLGQDREAQLAYGPLGVGAFAPVTRALRLAEELGLPVVAIVDTAGAEVSVAAEEGGLAQEIARCLAAFVSTTAPTLSVLLGEGCGAAALALLPADRVLAAAHAWLAPLPLEAAAFMTRGTVEAANAVARSQHGGARDLARSGFVDVVIPELPDAAEEAPAFCARVGRHIAQELAGLSLMDPVTRRAGRDARIGGG